MKDEREGPLLVPDPSQRILTPREARELADNNRKYGPGGKRIRPPADHMQDPISRDEATDKIAHAVLVATQKMYDQFSEETGTYLREMHSEILHAAREEIRREFERRTVRGRIRAIGLWLRDSTLGGYLMEIGLLSPLTAKPQLVVDAVDVLDPNVHSAEILPLEWRAPAKYSDETQAFIEAGGVAILPHAHDGKWYVVANNAATLRRASAALGGEQEIEDGTTALQLLDVESLELARSFVASAESKSGA